MSSIFDVYLKYKDSRNVYLYSIIEFIKFADFNIIDINYSQNTFSARKEKQELVVEIKDEGRIDFILLSKNSTITKSVNVSLPNFEIEVLSFINNGDLFKSNTDSLLQVIENYIKNKYNNVVAIRDKDSNLLLSISDIVPKFREKGISQILITANLDIFSMTGETIQGSFIRHCDDFSEFFEFLDLIIK